MPKNGLKHSQVNASSGVDADANGCFGSSGSSPGLNMEQPLLLTRVEAAHLLNVSISAVRKWQREGRLAVVKLGSSVRIPMSDLQRLISTHTSPANGQPDGR